MGSKQRGGRVYKQKGGARKQHDRTMINPEQQSTPQMSLQSQGFTPMAGSDELFNHMLMYDSVFLNPMDLTPEVFQPIPNLPPMPDQFCTEFYEYDRESYRQAPRKRVKSEEPSDPAQPILDESSPPSSAELRRQIHIQSEQKRRAQIKDGFEELRKQLPNCNNKQVSKASILSKTVVHLQHLKSTQHVLVQEIERLRLENEQLRGIQSLMYPNKLYSMDL